MQAGSRVLCLTLLGLACGRTEEAPGGASSGGAGTTASGGAIQSGGRVASGGSSSGGVAVADGGAPQGSGGQTPQAGGADSGGQGGASLPKGGSQSSSGGSPSSGGSTTSSGMGGVAAGSGGASAGSAGAAGDGGTVSCEDYVACGCGCCGITVSPPSRCYYPDVAGDLEAIVAADQAASQSANCASAGCSLGTQYTCCEGLSPDPTPSTYSTTLTIGAYDRVHVTKEGAPSCARIVLMAPGPTASRLHTALELPTGWQWDMAFHGVCSLGSAANTWIGASGSVKVKPQGVGCAVDVHLTAFFAEGGAVVPVRFDVEGLAVDGLSPTACD